MATPPLRTPPPLPSAGAAVSRPPPKSKALTAAKKAANGGVAPLGDEAIWKRLREAGFDEESVKRRDKAALIAYITKLETEIYDYQHHMGLLIIERKEWTSKYEQLKASSESAELAYKREQAAHMSALAEARAREQSLQKALGIEKECVANIEKALHDMRAESAEGKVAYESKFVEARKLMETAEEKFNEAEKKLLVAESLQAEASRTKNTALRTLEDVEAREDELNRRLLSLKSEYDAKEKEISTERQALRDRQKILHEEQERLLEEQTLLNHREEYSIERLKELSRLEKELEESKSCFLKESRGLKEERSNLELEIAAFKSREQAILQRESLLDKRERELLVLQEKIACKEHEEAQRILDEHQSLTERKRIEFEAEIEQRRKLLEHEIETRRRECEARESDLGLRENAIQEREHAFESQLSLLAKEQENLAKKFSLLEEKEQNLGLAQRAAEIEVQNLQKERDDISKMKEELGKAKARLEDEKKEILRAEEKMQLTLSERNELLVLEMKLKEEIDSFRALKMALVTEADNLKAEKEKFEIEWEVIDRKREELKKEAERIDEERKAVMHYLKEEYDCIKLEKDNLLSKYKSDAESLSHEREEFIREMDCHRADWFRKIQQERENVIRDFNIQRNELENSIKKRWEEVEAYLKEQVEAFEKEKARELLNINSQKESIAKELEHAALEMEKLSKERREIARDREQREKEWAEIRSSIEALNVQCKKLQKQRDMLHSDREEIYQKIQQLKELENLKIECENKGLSEMHTDKCIPIKRASNKSVEQCFGSSDGQVTAANGKSAQNLLLHNPSNTSPPASVTKSWVRKCTEVIFRHSPERGSNDNHETNVERIMSGKFKGLGSPDSDSKVNNHFDNVNGSNDINMPTFDSPLGEKAHMSTNNEANTSNCENIGPTEHYGKKSRFLVGSVNSWLLGRKRGYNVLSDELSNEQLEPHRKLQKRPKQDGVSGAEEVSCTPKGELSRSDHESEPPLRSGALGVEELHDRDHENPENGKPHESARSISGNGLFSHTLQFLKDDQDLDKMLSVAEQPSKDLDVSAGKLNAEGDNKIKDHDESNQYLSDESESEDEDRMSAKKKLWKFLIT